MNPHTNKDLYDYLNRVAQQLRTRGFVAAAEDLESAARQAASMSTEFLGESRMALQKVLAAKPDIIRGSERIEAQTFINEIDAALKCR